QVFEEIDAVEKWRALLKCGGKRGVFEAMEYLSGRIHGRPTQRLEGNLDKPVSLQDGWGFTPERVKKNERQRVILDVTVEMPTLKNPKHEIFASNLAAGKTQKEAAIAAGYKPSRARFTASRLMATFGNEIHARIAEVQQNIVDAQLVDAFKLHKR